MKSLKATFPLTNLVQRSFLRQTAIIPPVTTSESQNLQGLFFWALWPSFSCVSVSSHFICVINTYSKSLCEYWHFRLSTIASGALSIIGGSAQSPWPTRHPASGHNIALQIRTFPVFLVPWSARLRQLETEAAQAPILYSFKAFSIECHYRQVFIRKKSLPIDIACRHCATYGTLSEKCWFVYTYTFDESTHYRTPQTLGYISSCLAGKGRKKINSPYRSSNRT